MKENIKLYQLALFCVMLSGCVASQLGGTTPQATFRLTDRRDVDSVQPETAPTTVYSTIDAKYASYGVSSSSITFPKNELTATCTRCDNYYLVYFKYPDTTNSAIFEQSSTIAGAKPVLKGFTGGGALSPATLQAVATNMPSPVASNLYQQYESSAF